MTIDAITTNTAPESGPPGNRTFYRSPGQATGTPKVAGTSTSKSLDVSTTGSVNGLPVLDISLESLEDKPWRKPGEEQYCQSNNFLFIYYIYIYVYILYVKYLIYMLIND